MFQFRIPEEELHNSVVKSVPQGYSVLTHGDRTYLKRKTVGGAMGPFKSQWTSCNGREPLCPVGLDLLMHCILPIGQSEQNGLSPDFSFGIPVL